MVCCDHRQLLCIFQVLVDQSVATLRLQTKTLYVPSDIKINRLLCTYLRVF